MLLGFVFHLANKERVLTVTVVSPSTYSPLCVLTTAKNRSLSHPKLHLLLEQNLNKYNMQNHA